MTPEAAWKAIVEEYATKDDDMVFEDDIAGRLTPPDVYLWMERSLATCDELDVVIDVLCYMRNKTPDGRQKIKTIFQAIGSGHPQPVISSLCYDAARLQAAHDIYVDQEARRRELESEADQDDPDWRADPVAADRRWLSVNGPGW